MNRKVTITISGLPADEREAERQIKQAFDELVTDYRLQQYLNAYNTAVTGPSGMSFEPVFGKLHVNINDE